MRLHLIKVPFACVLAVSAVSFFPQVVAAAKLDLYNPRKHYGDEHVVIANNASRCTTAVFKAVDTAAETQAKKDLAARTNKDGTVAAKTAAAFKTYENDIAMGWFAMQQPYCGFGAFGPAAAKKSFLKTISRARTNFLNGVTQIAAVAPTKKIALSSTPAAASAVVTAPASSVGSLTLVTDLKMGDASAQVTRMQTLLMKKGFLAAGLATGYFGALTEKALIAFQIKQGIITSGSSPGAGLVGPRTRSALMN